VFARGEIAERKEMSQTLVFFDEMERLKALLFNQSLDNLVQGNFFDKPRDILGYLEVLLAVVLRTDSPHANDPHFRQWLRLKQYVVGFQAEGQSRRKGLIEILFDCLESLLPQEFSTNTALSSGPNTCTQGKLVFQLRLNRDHPSDCFICLNGLSSHTTISTEQSPPTAAMSEAFQLQIEILHIIGGILRVIWKLFEWKEPDELISLSMLENWHPQLGMLPRVLQRFYKPHFKCLEHENKQSVWSDCVQRIRHSDTFKDDALIECLTEQVWTISWFRVVF
jgi:hypothetical protein